jgi:hypothetical protein
MSALSGGEQRLERSPAGDRYRSLVKLQAAIKCFLAETNDNPKPSVWTTDPEKISPTALDLASAGLP